MVEGAEEFAEQELRNSSYFKVQKYNYSDGLLHVSAEVVEGYDPDTEEGGDSIENDIRQAYSQYTGNPSMDIDVQIVPEEPEDWEWRD